ncbi:hypothetical protein F0562_025801 [Nyssa sinensis]|uniref:Uncharacterized protein n=1 Tax=Nyssa sinensis TaxID=561372 RepID=A0A5J5B8U1_9ASTE|nr:hypothetical protein F0562_025801 [Nyssa sinensis]
MQETKDITIGRFFILGRTISNIASIFISHPHHSHQSIINTLLSESIIASFTVTNSRSSPQPVLIVASANILAITDTLLVGEKQINNDWSRKKQKTSQLVGSLSLGAPSPALHPSMQPSSSAILITHTNPSSTRHYPNPSFTVTNSRSSPRPVLIVASANIFAVTDTLLAGEKRIDNQHDWYAILQLSRLTHASELIAPQYRRLALLLHPLANKLAFADDTFPFTNHGDPVSRWHDVTFPMLNHQTQTQKHTKISRRTLWQI